jgi:hypothetical protein
MKKETTEEIGHLRAVSEGKLSGYENTRLNLCTRKDYATQSDGGCTQISRVVPGLCQKRDHRGVVARWRHHPFRQTRVAPPMRLIVPTSLGSSSRHLSECRLPSSQAPVTELHPLHSATRSRAFETRDSPTCEMLLARTQCADCTNSPRE